MAIHAVDTTFTQFLNPNETKIYTIPIYQREYSWKQEHCEALLSDIQENDPNYFIGSIIWVENTNEVIDGQQRLTSLNLLLVAIYNRMCTFVDDEDINFKKSSLKRMIVSDKKTRLVPQKQGKNKEDFEYLLNSEIIKVPAAKPSNYGNRRISKNYNWFKEYVDKLDVNETIQLFDKICGLTFISASVDNAQTAFILFETMNNRGMALSAIDLIKNSYLSRTDDEDSISNWEILIEILGNESNQEQFLRNNYNAFRSEYNNLSLPLTTNPKYDIANKATRSNVIKIYGSLVDRKDFMEFLTLNAKYNSLLTGEEKLQIDVSEEFKTTFKNFRNANATSAFTLLLYLLRNQIVFGFDDTQLLDLFELTLKFFIRRNLTNIPSTGALPQILMNIIERINQLDKKDFVDVRKILLDEYQNKTSSNEAVKEILYGDIYDTNRDMARYLLCSLCKFEDKNEKKFIDLWEKKDDKYIWTIEHILPEGNKDATNTPNEWIEMIKQGDVKYKDYSNEQVYALVKDYRHKIGNLTMTGYNSSLGNKKFFDKKDRYDSKGEKIGYNNGLSLNEYVYAQSAWYLSNIDERTKDLADEIIASLEIK